MSHDYFAVIGDPIEHSLSPRMQIAAFDAAHLSGTYQALRVTAGELAGTVAWLRRNRYRGFNVTIPHKRTIVPLLDRVHQSARTTGAVNTVAREDDELVGHNTDIEGFDMALSVLAGSDWSGPALVFGAGGAARAVVVALAKRGCRIAVSNRTPEAIPALAAQVGYAISPVRGADECVAAVAKADLLVNATALGMGNLARLSPLPAGARFRPGTFAIDLVYGNETPFMRTARDGGCRVQDGVEMLVRQGAAAFQIWTGVEPDIAAMRAACRARLVEVGR